MTDPIRIDSIRREFNAEPMCVAQLPENPHQLFEYWFSQVLETKLDDPTACVLATVDQKNIPDTRVVLLKHYTNEAFIFYTNYTSQKAQQLKHHPWAALNFYWPSLSYQVRIRGQVKKIDAQASEKYFHSRPRDSQIAAYASRQSQITTREALEENFAYYQNKFESETSIPYPEFWGGFALTPIEFEFWQGRHYRLHDRVHYYQENGMWNQQILAP